MPLPRRRAIVIVSGVKKEEVIEQGSSVRGHQSGVIIREGRKTGLRHYYVSLQYAFECVYQNVYECIRMYAKNCMKGPYCAKQQELHMSTYMSMSLGCYDHTSR